MDPVSERKQRLREHVPNMVNEHGSPVYVFFEDDIKRRYENIITSINHHYKRSDIYFAVKSNFNPAIVSLLGELGCSAEVFSHSELCTTQAAGFDPDRVLMTGLNNDRSIFQKALRLGVNEFVIDNQDSLTRLISACDAVGTTGTVLLRVNPAINVDTEEKIATGTPDSRFGVDIQSGRAKQCIKRIIDADSISFSGLHVHLGSQISSVEPYKTAVTELLTFAHELYDDYGTSTDVIDMGGGYPIQYQKPVPDIGEYIEGISSSIREATKRLGLPKPQLYVEPGRYLVGSAGAIATTVGTIKTTPHATFAITDIGTNFAIETEKYPIYALNGAEEIQHYHVAGPLCYSGDTIRESVALPELSSGDLVTFDRAGAYCLGGANNFNATPKPPIVLIRSDGSHDLIQRRESPGTIIEKARVPQDL